MAAPIVIRTAAELAQKREVLKQTAEAARAAVLAMATDPRFLQRLKFERLGSDPLDPGDRQNIAEQIDQQATYEAALDGLEYLWRKHPEAEWLVAPGAHGSGHDIQSTDGTIAAEVFAAVDPKNNRKLESDIKKVSGFVGSHRYVIFRSPARPAHEWQVENVQIVSLGC